jgi:MFS family permease
MGDRNAVKRQDIRVRGAGAARGPVAVLVWSRPCLAARRARDPLATRQRGTLAAVTLAMFCIDVSFLALMLALPDMARAFGKSPEVMQDALSAYLLSFGAMLAAAGGLGDVAGRRRIFVAGCLLFAVTMAGAGLAPSLPVLIVFRVLQGAGAGLMLPTGIALVTASYRGADRQARALGLTFALATAGTVIGPFFGGWLAEGPGWRWIFWVLVPVAVLAVAVTVRFVPESRRKGPAVSFDFPGAVMVILAVAAVGTGIDRADSVGWSGVNIALLAAGLAVIAIFPVRARRAAHPLLDLSVFRNPGFGLVLFLGAACSACYAATVFVVSVDLQDARRLTAVRASLVFAVMAALAALAAPAGARLRSASRPVLVMAGAGLIVGGALVGLAVVTSWWGYVPALAVCGFGLGLGASVASIASQQAADPDQAGQMSGICLTIRTTVAGISLAVTASIVDAFTHGGRGTAAACDLALLAVAFLSVTASLTATAAGYAVARRGRAKPSG